jgi:glycosyltransferase involved in cell wall biosynthesis
LHQWHVITGEYPPQPGGVSDYAHLVSCELARAGDEVDVWTSEDRSPLPNDDGVEVHRLPGEFGPKALAILDRAIATDNGHRVLVQYVPHAFGWKAMNLGFCALLFARQRRWDITVMFHEVAFPTNPADSLRYRLLGRITLLMAQLTAKSANRIYVSCSSWERLLRRIVLTQPITSMPVPSNVPVVNEPSAISVVRGTFAPKGLLVGHLGTYAESIRDHLKVSLPVLLQEPCVSVVLLGRGSAAFCDLLLETNPELKGRIHAVNGVSSRALSLHLSACDLMLQPYPDGISTRRTSAMAALAHGRPVLTTEGPLTEAFWVQSGAVATASVTDPVVLAQTAKTLLQDDSERKRLGRVGRQLYNDRFDVRHTIDQLRRS